MAAITNQQSQARETSSSPPTLQNALSDAASVTNVESPNRFAFPPTSTAAGNFMFNPTTMQGMDVQQLQQMYLSYLFSQYGPMGAAAMRMGNTGNMPQGDQDISSGKLFTRTSNFGKSAKLSQKTIGIYLKVSYLKFKPHFSVIVN